MPQDLGPRTLPRRYRTFAQPLARRQSFTTDTRDRPRDSSSRKRPERGVRGSTGRGSHERVSLVSARKGKNRPGDSGGGGSIGGLKETPCRADGVING